MCKGFILFFSCMKSRCQYGFGAFTIPIIEHPETVAEAEKVVETESLSKVEDISEEFTVESEVEIPTQSSLVVEEILHEAEVEKAEIPEIESQDQSDIKLDDKTVDIIASEDSDEESSEHRIVADDNQSVEQTERKLSGEKLSNYPEKNITHTYSIELAPTSKPEPIR